MRGVCSKPPVESSPSGSVVSMCSFLRRAESSLHQGPSAG